MKSIKTFIKTLIITAGLALCGASAVLAANYTGKVEGVEGGIITGWAKDTQSLDVPAKVTVYVMSEDGSEVIKEQTVTAADYRASDLVDAHTSGYCGFSWKVDWSELENRTYRIKASIGSKPIWTTLTYTNTEGIEPEVEEEVAAEAEHDANNRYAGTFKTTAYCPCYSCSEGWGRKTSTGATARASHTIAVDPKVIPYGTKVMIDGVIYTAEDRGGGVKGNHIDIFYDSHSETYQHGVRYKDVYIIG